MQREIKFRGKTLDTGEWVHGYLYEAQDRAWIIREEGLQSKPNDVNGPAEYDSEPVWYEVYPKTAGQFIGLKDKNGVDIYEDDIIAWKTGFKLDEPGQRMQMRYHFGQLGTVQTIPAINSTSEVIANIHDNPELVKGE